MQRIAGLIKEDGREIQKIKTGLDQFWVSNDDLNAFFHFPRVPGLSLVRRDVSAQYGNANSLLSEKCFQSRCYIPRLRVDRENLATAPFSQFALDLLDQSSFFRVRLVLR